jgi:hypothetical protein
MTRRITFARLLGLTGIAVVVLAALALVVGAVTGARAQARQQVAFAHLVHAPSGTAHLAWNATAHTLTVTLQLVGLTPSSTHPAGMHAGGCAGTGSPIATLEPVLANAAGVGTSTTTLTPPAGAMPAGEWSVVVHNGPAMTPAIQGEPIACGDVRPAAGQQPANTAMTVAMLGTGGPSQQATGTAALQVHNGSLTVTVTARHLAPNSSHPEHIHAGSCQQQTPGSIVYMLQPLVADANGNARAVTVLHSVATIPASGWYVNVHRASDLNDPWGFDPILCGNVVGK